jgi:rhodanese-related sulfurtransferase
MNKRVFLFLILVFSFYTVLSTFSITNNKDVREDLKKYLDPKEMEKLSEDIKNGTENNVVIIDVRPEAVFNKGHVPGAINITNGIISEDQTYLKDKDLVLYCETGGRVEFAKTNLIKNGFDKKRMLNFGGFSRYKGPAEK